MGRSWGLWLGSTTLPELELPAVCLSLWGGLSVSEVAPPCPQSRFSLQQACSLLPEAAGGSPPPEKPLLQEQGALSQLLPPCLEHLQ